MNNLMQLTAHSPGFEMHIIRSQDELTGLAVDWDNLVKQYFPHLCNTFTWHHLALINYQPKSQLAVIAFTHGGKLVGIAPFCFSKTTFAKLPVQKYHFFEQFTALSTLTIHNDFLQPALEMMAHREANIFSAGHIVSFTADQSQWQALYPILKNLQSCGFQIYCRPRKILQLQANEAEQFQRQVLSKRTRKNYRKMERRLQQAFRTEVITPSPAELSDQFKNYWGLFLEIYENSWKENSHKAVSRIESHHEFYYSILEKFSKENHVRLALLTLDDKPAAAAWWIEYEGTCYGIQTAYSSGFSSYSPGSYLLHRHLKYLIDRGIHHFDFMGNHAYKKHFATHHRGYLDLYLFTKKAYGKMLSRLVPFSRISLQPLDDIISSDFPVY
ncbi:MAG: GNAT family N-acetyltransferase [Calditrichia bacterium]